MHLEHGPAPSPAPRAMRRRPASPPDPSISESPALRESPSSSSHADGGPFARSPMIPLEDARSTQPFGAPGASSRFRYRCPAKVTGVTNDAGFAKLVSSKRSEE